MVRTFEADLPDDELRRRQTLKWAVAADGELPAWVAETDFAHCPAVLRAVQEAVARGSLGYPPPERRTGLPEATAAFLGRRFGWAVDPGDVRLCGDVMSGVQLALAALTEDAPVVVPTPTYPPLLDVVPLAGRKPVPVPALVDGDRAALDLDGIDAALRDGARTVLLANPHNPLGRVYSRAELEALREVVLRNGARVVVDEIHAPLVLPGATHVPYAALPGASEHTTTVLSASKAFNVPALKCAQLVLGSRADAQALRDLPTVANHGVSTLGVAANVAAFTEGDAWLDELVDHLDAARRTFSDDLARLLPQARVLPLEASYLAWVDVRGYGHDDPAAVCRDRGRLLVNDGRAFGPGGEGHVRVNLGTSLERVREIVRRLHAAMNTAR
jgi:cysteine-S-conjugate beta-lyase